MYPKQIRDLIDDISKLPSIGPKQATRIAFSLLKKPNEFLDKFSKDLSVLKKEVALCQECFLTYEKNENSYTLCSFCLNQSRKKDIICVIEKEIEVGNIEQSGVFDGTYHIIGDDIDILNNSQPPLRAKKLIDKIQKLKEDKKEVEVILATNPTAEGDALMIYLEQILIPLEIKITKLGRGLASGGELEYADQNTLSHAFKNRN